MPQNFKNRSVDASRYAMVPRADVPRSAFKVSSSHKTTFNCGDLIPIYVDEVLPGDSHSVRMTAFCRLGTVLFPIMDNLHLDTFFFFVPNRLVWDNWVKMMGERDSPADSISYVVPQVVSPVAGWAIGSIGDYFGLPTVGQLGGAATYSASALPFRAYNLIYNEWFRDQSIQLPNLVDHGDGPDSNITFPIQPRGKRPDYFTTCLPWPQKPALTTPFGVQGMPVPYERMGLATQIGAPVTGIAAQTLTKNDGPFGVYETGQGSATFTYDHFKEFESSVALNRMVARTSASGELDIRVTIASIRLAFQAQRMMERDARGGTRYAELVRSHFGVNNPDARLQRPEYLGGGSTPVNISPIAQQSATGLTGATTPLGHLSATATGVAQGHGFSQSFTEHGWIIGIASVRADLNYYHGVHKMWNRSTKFDFYWPAFAQLGEQAVLARELYADGSAADIAVFGYQERWAEYRSKPGIVTSRFRGNAAGTLDAWHLAQRFTAHPLLNAAFILDPAAAVVRRALAAGSAADGQQVLFDGFFDIRRVRALPMFSVPGLVDHF